MWGNWLASYLVGRALGWWFFVLAGIALAVVIGLGLAVVYIGMHWH